MLACHISTRASLTADSLLRSDRLPRFDRFQSHLINITSWMNSQQLQSWANTHPSQPAGWQGQWPPRAPPGPPPAPQGVDPSRWFGGQWHFNPMFQTVAPQSVQTTAWAPHPSWGQISYPAGFNPWTTAPPKQEQGRSRYWDVELSDNPLRLEGMDHWYVISRCLQQD